MKPRITTQEGFQIWGKSVRTTNLNGQSLQDQGALWGELMHSGYLMPLLGENKKIIGLYSHFEGDHTKPFTFTLGALSEGVLPQGGVLHTVESGAYAVFEAAADSPQQAAMELWTAIWTWSAENPSARSYKTDFEIWDWEELKLGGKVRVEARISCLEGGSSLD